MPGLLWATASPQPVSEARAEAAFHGKRKNPHAGAEMAKLCSHRRVAMIEIPLGKALTTLEREVGTSCADCHFRSLENCFERIACRDSSREDGREVIYKLIDINEDTGGAQ